MAKFTLMQLPKENPGRSACGIVIKEMMKSMYIHFDLGELDNHSANGLPLFMHLNARELARYLLMLYYILIQNY